MPSQVKVPEIFSHHAMAVVSTHVQKQEGLLKLIIHQFHRDFFQVTLDTAGDLLKGTFWNSEKVHPWYEILVAWLVFLQQTPFPGLISSES